MFTFCTEHAINNRLLTRLLVMTGALFSGAFICPVRAAPPTFNTTALADVVVNQAFNQTIVINASPALSILSVSGQPSTLTVRPVDNNKLALSGTPTVAGDYTLTVTAVNADGQLTPNTLKLKVSPLPANPTATGIAAGESHSCAVIGGACGHARLSTSVFFMSP